MAIRAFHNKLQRTDDSGFTLIELMIALTIMLLVMSAIFSTFQSQSRSWVQQQEIANMQQNLRAGMYYLERSIRMAGYDPRHSKAFGFVSNFPVPLDGFGATTDGDDIAFTVDDDEDKVVDNNTAELVAYRRNPLTNELQFLDVSNSNTWTTVAENISSVAFTYLDEDNLVTTDPNDIRVVQITLTASSSRASVTSTRSITSRVRCRNI